MGEAGVGMSTPVGCVLPYAGLLGGSQLKKLGWAICDGSSLPRGEYGALYSAIEAISSDDSGSFKLPDFRGLFLRGADPGGAIDPDSSARRSATGEENCESGKAALASIQGFATAAPVTSFVATVAEGPSADTTHNSYGKGTNADMLLPGPSTFGSTGGGDAETRPVNAYVRFIIQMVGGALVPTGVVVPFAGNSPMKSPTLAAWYLYCNGTALQTGGNKELYDAIQDAHGGGGGSFNLPDYRGRFLRAVDDGAERDPNAAKRAAAAPGGATGDAVGSVQDWATAPPTTPFTVSFNVGTSDWWSDHALGHDLAMWNDGSVSIALTGSGGDRETRPVNIAVDHYILRKADPGKLDIFPVGAVIGFLGSSPPPEAQWAICDGSLVSTDGQFADLYAAIGDTNGGDGGEHFNLPNYEGYFMRGADRAAGRDPDADKRVAAAPGGEAGDNVGSLEGFATARPKSGDIVSDANHFPNADADNADALSGPSTAAIPEWDQSVTSAVKGGDSETRPINASVAFYIKYFSNTNV